MKWPNPFDESIADAAITDWIEQFEPQERPIIEKLLKAFRYYSPTKVNNTLKELHRSISESVSPRSNIWFVPVGYVAKSGSLITYLYSTQNDIPQERFFILRDLTRVQLAAGDTIVFLDDYIGSGHQARQVWDSVVAIFPPQRVVKYHFIFGALIGTEHGIEHVDRSTGFSVIIVDRILRSDLPLNEESEIYPDVAEREKATQILEKYGALLNPSAPLGYEASQGLLGFFYSTPNNTLPIFWSTENGWKPLLPHKESYRDPAFLIGPPAGLSRDTSLPATAKPLLETALLSEYAIDHEIASKIIGEFKRTDVLLVLAPVIKALGLTEPVVKDLLRLLTDLRHLEHERQSVCTSLLLTPLDIASDSLGKFSVSASKSLTLSATKDILSIAQIIDGFEGAVVADSSGRVLGTMAFRKPGYQDDLMVPERFRRAARVSLDTRGLLFVFPGNGRVLAFHAGRRVLTYRAATWHLQPTDLERGILQIAEDFSLDLRSLRDVFRLAFRLSDEGEGALITIGDHENVLKYSEKPHIPHIEWQPMHLESADDATLLGLFHQDGATIISNDGILIQTMTFLRPPVEAAGEVEVGKGSKHSTAAKISAITKCLAIAVSVDGLITTFANGSPLFKLMG